MAQRYIRRGGMAVPKKQYETLCLLRDEKAADRPLVPLVVKTRWDRQSLNSMQKKDWIVESRYAGEVRYTITGRGLKVLEKSAPLPETSDMCFQCGEHPRYVSPQGRRLSYCKDCHNAYNTAWYASTPARKPSGACPGCGAPRHVTKNGRTIVYCKDCHNRNVEASKAKIRERTAQQKAEGTLPLCSKCGEQQIYTTPTNTFNVCQPCFNAARRVRQERALARRMQEKLKDFSKRP